VQGLGKTIQVIALVAALLGKTGRRVDDIRPPLSPYSERKILIVVPTSVLGNWKNEFERWVYFAPNALGLAHGDQVFASSYTHSESCTFPTEAYLTLSVASKEGANGCFPRRSDPLSM
jgi:SNF2 family DNA or RNA helicase